MRIVPLIEIELDCTVGSPVDYQQACGFSESAVCTGVLLELLMVAGRELGAQPVCLRDLVLAGHAPIGTGMRLLGRAYEGALEVIGGALGGSDWTSTHAYAELADSTALAAAAPDAAVPPIADPCVLEQARTRAGGEALSRFLVDARRDQARSRLRLVIDPEALAELESYALHPLLWEAGIAAAEHLLAGHATPAVLQRAVRVSTMSMYTPGGRICAIDIGRQGLDISIRWLGEGGALVAQALGVSLGPALGQGASEQPAHLRCARIVYDTLGKRVADPHQPLAELGVSSIDRARVAAALALDFGCKPKLEAIVAAESLAGVVSLFANAAQSYEPSELAPRSIGPDARFVLSPAQQQVWALQAMAPDTPRCHVYMRLRFAGAFDEAKLAVALERLLERHASLRVVIDASGEQPLQRVLATPLCSLERHDVSALPAAEREAALLRHSDQHARAQFDLERGPPVRFALVALGPREHALLICVHHLIVDGFGLELMVRELLALYENPDVFAGEVFGLEHVAELYLPAVPLKASGVFPARDAARRLPLARDPNGEPNGVGARADVPGLSELTARLRALAQREQVSLFALLCAAYGYVLARHAGQDEVAIGVVSAGRTTLDQLNAVGMFARSVPLRLAIDPDASLLAVARDIHARVPHLVAEESTSQDASPFAATALFQQWSQAPLHTVGLEVRLELDSPDGAPSGYCRAELELLAADFGAELSACLQYERASLHERTATWLAEAIGALLAQACEQPHEALRRMPLASSSTALELVGPSLPIQPPLVHRMIAERAAATPAATAVRDALGARLSFEALIIRAHALARALRARGAGPGRFVAVLAERTADLPVAVLAVLQSGAAYVPIDPGHPSERVELALTDTGVELVIALTDTERTYGAAEVVALSRLLEESSAGPSVWEAPQPSDVAYVLHTSGSTGRPKGVVIEHASLASFVLAMQQLLPASAREPWLALTTLAFDISILELLFPLAIGAETRVGTAPSLRSGEHEPFAVLRMLGREVRCFQCTPSLARLLLEDADGRAFLAGLSLLLVGGESLPVWLARALCSAVTGAVFNMYGPTETTVWSSAARLSAEAAWVPIGQPIANTKLRVVDDTGCDVAPGLSGELWIGGAGLAREYLQRPDETAARFVSRDGQRFYRTGDLVRMRVVEEAGREAHALEWLGRMDRQIKLAGNRIELGEIEGVLTQHPFARECAMITEGSGAEERLVAFVVPDTESMADAITGRDTFTGIFSHQQIEAVLLAWAEQKLPAYMLPARMVFLDGLPRTASGKTDRRALAELAARARVAAPALSERPVTREEKLLASLWTEVLARAEVGRYDDFFALGGTSFAAVLLASRARKQGIVLAPSTVLAHPTLAAQALQISVVVMQREARALEEDVHLADLPEARGTAAWPPKQVVLTGATGFLGAHLLIELQASLEAEVVCLIRARDDHAARERLERSLETWGLGSRVQWRLTRCLAADLTLPRFGLSDEEWQLLAERADLVVHNAADVNFALGYDELRAANVGGTRTAIALAAEGKRKPLHYVSTIAITEARDPGTRVDEGTPLPRCDRLLDGYSQSKWVAEGIVRLAADRGLDATCYRAGPLVLDRAPKGDALAEALATVARSGIAFATRGRGIPHLSRVDDTARAIVTLALDRTRRARVEHVVSPQRLAAAELLSWIREWGFEVTELSDEEWLARIDSEAWAAATMFVVSQRLRDGVPLVPEVEHAATLVRLSALGFSWRDIDGVLIQRLLARLTDSARAETG